MKSTNHDCLQCCTLYFLNAHEISLSGNEIVFSSSFSRQTHYNYHYLLKIKAFSLCLDLLRILQYIFNS